MTAPVIDLAHWRRAHPPPARLAAAVLRCWLAWWRLCWGLR